MTITATQAINSAVSAAKDVPDLIAKLNAIDPALGQQLAGKGLAWSKTPWGTLAGTAIGWAIPHYGLACAAVAFGATAAAAAAQTTGCWSDDTVNTIEGVGVVIGTLVGSYVMRWVTNSPIAGWFAAAPPAPPAAKAAA